MRGRYTVHGPASAGWGKMTGRRARGGMGPDRLSYRDEAQTGSAGVLLVAGRAN